MDDDILMDSNTAVLEYDGWSVCLEDGEFYYYHDGEREHVELVASLYYDIMNDCKIDTVTLSEMFDNTCCGEQVTDNYIAYLWFK
jgi:hypothetical protein